MSKTERQINGEGYRERDEKERGKEREPKKREREKRIKEGMVKNVNAEYVMKVCACG